jgi:hypothetical protein
MNNISTPKWSVETLQVYTEALRSADERFTAERDRRYAEVALEREKAIKIKETADLAALQLAREIQQYKDEKANQLREQINSERGLYASKDDLNAAVRELSATIAPLVAYISAKSGETKGVGVTIGAVYAIIIAVGTSIASTAAIIHLVH